MDVDTERLRLHATDEPEARRIQDGAPIAGDPWEVDYPFAGDLIAVGALLRAIEHDGDQGPFGYYQIRRRSDGLAIGGIGFKGRPVDGVVEIGYGLAPSARGHGYATEAVRAMVAIAGALGVTTVRADTEPANVASQLTLTRAGFTQVEPAADLDVFEIRTDEPPSP